MGRKTSTQTKTSLISLRQQPCSEQSSSFGDIHDKAQHERSAVLSTSLDFGFVFLIDNVLSGTICLFRFSALFSKIYCKINFIVQNGSELWSVYKPSHKNLHCLHRHLFWSPGLKRLSKMGGKHVFSVEFLANKNTLEKIDRSSLHANNTWKI